MGQEITKGVTEFRCNASNVRIFVKHSCCEVHTELIFNVETAPIQWNIAPVFMS